MGSALTAVGLVITLAGAMCGALSAYASKEAIQAMHPGPVPLTADQTEIREIGGAAKVAQLERQNWWIVTGFSLVALGTFLQLAALLLD